MNYLVGRLSERVLAVVGVLAVAGHARAEVPEASPADAATPPVTSARPSPAPSLPPPEDVNLVSMDTPGSLRVQGPGIEGDAGACPDSCTLKLAPGNYSVLAPDDPEGHSFPLNLPGASRVVLDPGNPVLRGLGMGMMIVGSAAFVVGAAALYYDIDSRRNRQGCVGNVCDADAVASEGEPYERPSWVVPAMVAGAIGGVVALGGTAIYLTWRPSVSVTPLHAAGARPRTGAGFELTGSF